MTFLDTQWKMLYSVKLWYHVKFLLLLLGYFQITWAFYAFPKQQHKEDQCKKHNHKVRNILSWETLMGEKTQQKLPQ